MTLLRRHALPALLLAGVTFLYFYRSLFLGEVLHYRDLGLFHYPLRRLWISELLQGHLPFLNPMLNGGQPILSNPNYSVFYPGNLLYLLLPFDMAWNLLLAGHVFWAMLGFYFLARDLPAGRPAALTGALIFGVGGPLLSCLTYYNLLITGAWLPWVILLARRALAKQPRNTALAILALSAMLLAAEPTILLFSAVLLLGIFLLSARDSQQRRGTASSKKVLSDSSPLSRGRSGGGWTAFLTTVFQPPSNSPLHKGGESVFQCYWPLAKRALLILMPSLMIGCIQWIPAALWLPYTSRGEGMDFRLSSAYWSLHPLRSIEFLAPGFYGNVMSPYASDFWGGRLSDGGYPYVLKLYCGWLPWILAPLAWRRKAGRYALWIVFAGILLSFGHRLPGYKLVYDLVLPFRVVRYPEKFLILTQFGLALAASIGAMELLHGGLRKFMLLAGAVLVAGLAATALPAVDPLHAAAQHRALFLAAAFGFLAIGVLWIGEAERWRSRVLLMLPLLLALDLFPVTLPLADSIPADDFHRTPALLQEAPALQSTNVLHLGEDQADAYFSGGMEPDHLMREALHPLVGLNFGISYGAADDVDRMTWSLSRKRSLAIRHAIPAPAAVDRMRNCGVSQIISLRSIQSPLLLLEKQIRFAEGNQLYLYRPIQPPPPFVHWENGGPPPEWRLEAPYRLRILNRAGRGGSLVILRNALPGWTCLIDGKRSSIDQTEDGMIRIPVASDAREILMRYVPPGFTAAAVLSLCGLLASLAVSLSQRRGG